MASELIEICNYLHDILTFRNYIEIPDNKDSYFTISDEELKAGRLDKNKDRIKLLDNWRNKEKGENKTSLVDIILIPKIVSDIIPKYTSPRAQKKDQIWEYKIVSLLYIKATIDMETLQIKSKTGETIIWADPIIKKSESLFSKLLNRILRKKRNNNSTKFSLKDTAQILCRDDNWGQYVDAVDIHFKKRTGQRLFDADTLSDEYGKSHYLYIEDGVRNTIVMKDSSVFASMHIDSLLAAIRIEHKKRLPLFEKMILGQQSNKKLNTHKTGENINNHLGQMKNDFPLSEAQRDVLHCLPTIEEGDVLAVSGPPGTGKTTMLQSIVADAIVRNIIQSDYVGTEENAPLILATSSNNKAITNIIDAFSNNDENTSKVDLFHRWICYESEEGQRFTPLAVYCPAGSIDRHKTKNYFITDKEGGGNYAALRNHYYRNSSDFYYRASTALNIESKSLAEIEHTLKIRINNLNEELKKISNTINTRDDQTSLRNIIENLFNRYKSRLSIPKKRKDFIENPPADQGLKGYIDELLDLTLRYDLYWLAVHYNECKWVKMIEQYREKRDQLPKIYGKFLWNEIRLICPCIVATFYMAPMLFEYKTKSGQRTYNFNYVDLLIVDEAGQVSPEIGLPTFALAKKALVVGDVKQIPPVYSVPEGSEDMYWNKRITSMKAQSDRELLSCCRSNIMAIAEDRCVYERKTPSGKSVSGLFLNEHRRCVDEIIDYSNELIYEGELVPKRGSYLDRCYIKNLPPIGFYLVEGNSEHLNGSRCNRREITEISKWLKEHASIIEDAYNTNGRKSIHQLVSIITPFKAQSELIKQDEYLKNFPSGTVHTFQGAESPLVIFSLVYGDTDNPVFIKSNHELMNVAVSRAKDHFLIFGSRKCLENNQSDKACALLCKKSIDIRQ